MKISILTIFPEIFGNFLNTSLIKKAINSKKIDINLLNIRDYSKNKQKSVDDTPYGGGVGMLMMFPPVYDAIKDVKKEYSKVVYLSPQGITYNQKIAKKLKDEKHLILLCGRYEGIDERIKDVVDYEISIGDYILMGGEIPAMVLCESITRLIPGVIKDESVNEDTFENNLLKYPEYTKPAEYMGYKVPDVLLSGNHKKINDWRKEMQLKNTIKKRKDLLK